MMNAKKQSRSGGWPGLSIVLFGSLLATSALAQSKDCCNTQTGDWISAASAEACEAKPGHVSIADMTDPQDILKKMQQAMVCTQKTQGIAQQYMGMPAMPNIPGMPDLSTIPGMPPGIGGGQLASKTVEAEIADCCHINSKSWLGSMEVSMCLAEEGQFPDTEEYQGDVAICNGSGGGGGGGLDPEDVEINIANGGFESWDGDEPRGFKNFDGGEQVMQATAQAGVDMQAVFKSSDAHTGSYSLRLVAKKMELPPEAAQYVPTEMVPMIPGGVTSCGSNCAALTAGNPVTDKAALALSITDDEPGEYLCGVYKGRFVGGDELWINATVHRGSQVIGGTNSGSGAINSISKNAGQWIEFKMPISRIPGKAGQTFDRATIELTLKPAGGVRNLGLGVGKVHEGTEVKIDSVRFCGDLQITLYKPKVIGISRVKISNPDEEDIGAQTFVNLDNDDGNGKFDIDDEKGMSKDDNELIEMVLSLPVREAGYVELRLTSPSGAVKVWKDARKTEEFDQMDKPVEAPGFLEEKDGEWIRHLWVEGIKPSTSQRDVKFEFLYTEEEGGKALQDDKVTITILGIEKIELKGKENSIKDDDNLDEDPNWPGGFGDLKSWRVFPGKRWDGNQPTSLARNTVDVEVTLNVKPVEPVQLVFRAMDVDDPSANSDEVDMEDSNTDNRGETPSKRGGWPEGTTDYLKIDFYEDNKTFEFETTMQPGDNFRIVGGGDIMTLMNLENDDTKLSAFGAANTMAIVDPDVLDAEQSVDKARILEHEKYASDVLTVWRKFYLEIDKMGDVADNEVTGTITDYQAIGTASGGLQYTLDISKNLYASLPEESRSKNKGMNDAYKRGKMVIGGNDYSVTGNTAKNGANDSVDINYSSSWGPWDDSIIGMSFTMTDNDVLKTGSPLDDIKLDRLEDVFEPAYILPVEDEAPNSTKTVPFRLHYKKDDQAYLRSVYAFDNISYHNDPQFWVVYLLNGFQGMISEDGDGGSAGASGYSWEGAISGQADNTPGVQNGMGAVIFQESGRELASGNQNAPGWRLTDVAPHEIGHLFGGDHNQDGLMFDPGDSRNTGGSGSKSEDFSPASLDIIRRAKHP